MSSNTIVTSRRALHEKKSAAASEIRSRVQTKAKKPKNHLLYKNFRINVAPREYSLGYDLTKVGEFHDLKSVGQRMTSGGYAGALSESLKNHIQAMRTGFVSGTADYGRQQCDAVENYR
jgi:hypothetical protein